MSTGVFGFFPPRGMGRAGFFSSRIPPFSQQSPFDLSGPGTDRSDSYLPQDYLYLLGVDMVYHSALDG